MNFCRYESKEPVQLPISPAYAEAVRKKKGKGNPALETPATSSVPYSLHITLNFGGGAELLVGGKKNQDISLPEGSTMGSLLEWMIGKDGVVKERPELLVLNGDIRPGILVLINDTDWELCDTRDYKLGPKDTITFISTLHGG